ncbi:MAG: sulfurtransferase [Gammaproteobacteria bacterium]
MYEGIIQVQELNQYYDDLTWVIIDCRYDLLDKSAGYRAYLDSHIPNAIYADLHDDMSGPPVTDHGRHPLPSPARLNQLFSLMGISHDKQVVVYDASFGSIAARLWWMLRYMGHEAVAVMDGGWQAWQKSGLETEQEERKNNPVPFEGKVRQEWLVTLDDVMSEPMLVDSREPVRYRGEEEPLDPAAGHIPGAINHYWKSNLTEDGQFLASQQIRQVFLDFYGGIAPEEVVFYCGSGVTACHNLLAAAHAGLTAARLYAGSWSEWCSDPERPVMTGAEKSDLHGSGVD